MTTTPLKIKTDELYTCVFSSDGKRALTGATNTPVKQWDTETGKCLHSFDDTTTNAWCLMCKPDFRHAAMSGVDHALQVWDIESHRRLCALKGHAGFLRCADLTADIRFAISGCGYEKGGIHRWNPPFV